MTNAAFPAKAGPTDGTRCDCRTGFSREGAIACDARIQGPPLIGVGARLPAKRPVHPTHIDRPCLRLRGQARSYTGCAASHYSRLSARSVGAGFPAQAGPTSAFISVLTDCTRRFSGTGFSREEAIACDARIQGPPLIGVGARLPAKRPVHPTHIERPCLRLRGQARSYTGFAASHCSRLSAGSLTLYSP